MLAHYPDVTAPLSSRRHAYSYVMDGEPPPRGYPQLRLPRSAGSSPSKATWSRRSTWRRRASRSSTAAPAPPDPPPALTTRALRIAPMFWENHGRPTFVWLLDMVIVPGPSGCCPRLALDALGPPAAPAGRGDGRARLLAERGDGRADDARPRTSPRRLQAAAARILGRGAASRESPSSRLPAPWPTSTTPPEREVRLRRRPPGPPVAAPGPGRRGARGRPRPPGDEWSP